MRSKGWRFIAEFVVYLNETNDFLSHSSSRWHNAIPARRSSVALFLRESSFHLRTENCVKRECILSVANAVRVRGSSLFQSVLFVRMYYYCECSQSAPVTCKCLLFFFFLSFLGYEEKKKSSVELILDVFSLASVLRTIEIPSSLLPSFTSSGNSYCGSSAWLSLKEFWRRIWCNY